jgi:hypothetical protein
LWLGDDISKHEKGQPYEQQSPLSALAFAGSGGLLAIADYANAAAILDAVSGRHQAGCVGHTGIVFALAFAPDSLVLASGGNDGTVRLWETATGLEGGVLQAHTRRVVALAFSPAQVAAGQRRPGRGRQAVGCCLTDRAGGAGETAPRVVGGRGRPGVLHLHCRRGDVPDHHHGRRVEWGPLGPAVLL